MTVLAPESNPSIPPLTRGWRLRMSLEWAGLSREQMAALLGVSPQTVSRWMHDEGKRQPRRPDMDVWARACGVPLQWLAPDPESELLGQPTVA